MEAAAALRARGLEVSVVAPDAQPLARVLGPRRRRLPARRPRGARRALPPRADGRPPSSPARVTLSSGERLEAELVVVGIGVRPEVSLAEAAGLRLDRGVVVDERLQTSAPGVFAAGDIARYPDAPTGELVRIEHWAVAQRMGRVAALNMLGRRTPFSSAPFFWSAHYDVQLNYVGPRRELGPRRRARRARGARRDRRLPPRRQDARGGHHRARSNLPRRGARARERRRAALEAFGRTR